MNSHGKGKHVETKFNIEAQCATRAGQFLPDRRGVDFPRGGALVCYQGADRNWFIDLVH